MRVWPGAVSARRDLGRRGRQLRALLRERDGRRSLPLRRSEGEPKAARIAMRERTTRSGMPISPTSRPVSSTATACTGPTTPRRATASTGAKLLLDPYALAITGRVTWDDALFGYAIGDPRQDLAKRCARQRAARPEVRGRRWGVHLGRRSPAAHAVEPDGHLRGAREGDDDAPSRGSRGAARHLPRTRVSDPIIGSPARARRHRRRAHAGAPLRRRSACSSSAGSPTTGATTRSASSPPTRAMRPAAAAARWPSSSRW